MILLLSLLSSLQLTVFWRLSLFFRCLIAKANSKLVTSNQGYVYIDKLIVTITVTLDRTGWMDQTLRTTSGNIHLEKLNFLIDKFWKYQLQRNLNSSEGKALKKYSRNILLLGISGQIIIQIKN